MILCIIRQETDPYFNLAAEEYAMEHFADDLFMLWRNDPAVIVGRHQNTLAEINVDFVRENNIPVVRRLSGGGAVFHDLGNLNFTFITAGEPNIQADFRRFTQPILDTLRGLGIDAQFEGRNDLAIGGRKFSGNAEYIHGGRILHHGTLLFAAQVADVAAALRPDPAKFMDKAVKSVRSRITNISEHLPRPMTVLEFRDILLDHVMAGTPGAALYSFTDEDCRAIGQLRDAKYATWDWNYGHSPRYSYNKRIRATGGTVEVTLDVAGGIIRAAHLYGDYFTLRDPAALVEGLIGVEHDRDAIRERLKELPVESIFINIAADDLLEALI